MAPVRFLPYGTPENLLGGFGTVRSWGVGIAPADLVALGSGAKFALLALGRSFERAAAAHFLKDAFGVQFGLEAFESAVYGLAFFQSHSSHAVFLVGLVGFRDLVGARLMGFG